MFHEAEILAKIIGVHNDHGDEAEHHENVRKLFGLVFNDTLTEVQFIPLKVENLKALEYVSPCLYFLKVHLVLELCTESLGQYLKQRHSSLLLHIISQLGEMGSMDLTEV